MVNRKDGIQNHCSAHIRYSNNDEEDISLHTCQWRYASKRNRTFVPINDTLPKEPTLKITPKQKLSIGTEHKAKCFADDLTLISQTADEHQTSLTKLEGACNDLGLILKPSKCVSLTLLKGKPKKNAKYRLQNSETRNTCENPTKFLNHTVAATIPLPLRQLLVNPYMIT